MKSRDDIIAVAERYLGVPFVWHRHDYHEQRPETGFCCSGFVRYVLAEADRPMPSDIVHAWEMFDRYGMPVEESDAAPGDLMFFTKYGVMPDHVAIFAGDGKVIHNSSRTKEVAYSTLAELLEGPFPQTIDTSIRVKHPRRYFSNPVGYRTH